MRIALLGSLGVARPFNLPRKMVIGTPAAVIGLAGTFAAVPAGNHLDLVVVGVPGTLVIPFTGAEATRAAFEATINSVRLAFFQHGGFLAENQPVPSTQMQLRAFLLGSMGGIQVAATTSAAVLASLGLTSGQLSVPSSGVGLGSPHMRAAAVAFFGGVRPSGPSGLLPANQHAVVVLRNPRPDLLMVDRNAPTQGPTATSSDNTRFAPLRA